MLFKYTREAITSATNTMHTCLRSYYTTHQQFRRSNTAKYIVHSRRGCIIIYNCINLPCDYNITESVLNSDIILENKSKTTQPMGIHSQRKHKNRNVFGDSNIQYHDFNNGDALTFKDKYIALLQQELQNLYWCLHNPITTKSYQISSEMDVETMPHAMYFYGNRQTIAKINQVPYQVLEYDDKGMFQAKLMDNTQLQIFIDNEATPSILPLSVYNKYLLLQKYPKTESHTPIHTGGGMIESHFWIEIPLKLDN